MKKILKGYKQITLNVPEEVFRKATHTLKIKGYELKDYLLDLLKRTVKVEKKTDYANDSIWQITNLGKSKAGNLSVKHDKYLYGTK